MIRLFDYGKQIDRLCTMNLDSTARPYSPWRSNLNPKWIPLLEFWPQHPTMEQFAFMTSRTSPIYTPLAIKSIISRTIEYPVSVGARTANSCVQEIWKVWLESGNGATRPNLVHSQSGRQTEYQRINQTRYRTE